MSAQSEAGGILNFHRNLAAALLAVLALCSGDARADWVFGPKSQARMMDAGNLDGGRVAGVEIRLAGAAVTYWRDPGEAGVAPTFDFAASQNLAEAKILYPQPAKIDEDGVQAFGYQHQVLFPIRVTPLDKNRPVVLALSLDYAVCEAICLPAHAQMQLDMPPQPRDVEGAALIADALKQIPRPLDSAQANAYAVVAPAASAQGKSNWLVRFPQGGADEVFVEAPRGFYVESHPAGEKNAFLLTLAEHPAQKTAPDTPVRVTVGGPSPVEFDLALPQDPAPPQGRP